MTNLQTKSGEKFFTAYVEVAGVELAKVNGAVVAVLNGETLPGVVKKVEGHKLSELVSAIDPASLVGKDPTTFTADELAAFTQYLQDVAAGKVKAAPAKAEKSAKKEKKEAPKAEEKPAKKGKKEAAKKEEEKEEATLPEGIESVEDLEAMGAKALWKLAQPLGLEGVNSRSPKADLVKALAEYFDLEMEEEDEEEEDIENDEIEDADDEDDEESDEDDEDEDEDDESEEDDEDEEDEEEDEEDDEDEDSDDEDDEDEDEDEEEEDDELTAADIDAMETKEELIAVIKKHNIKLPSKKLTTRKVKEFIKETLFGDDE